VSQAARATAPAPISRPRRDNEMAIPTLLIAPPVALVTVAYPAGLRR
jgi:hypothetical protein